jgi:hypothetical protein
MARPKKTITAPPAESLPDIPILWQVPLSEPTHPLGDRAARDRHDARRRLPPPQGREAQRVYLALTQLQDTGVPLENCTQHVLRRLIEKQISGGGAAKKAGFYHPGRHTINREIKRFFNK